MVLNPVAAKLSILCIFDVLSECCVLAVRSSDVENAEERHRYERTISEPLRAVDPEQQELSGRRKPALVR